MNVPLSPRRRHPGRRIGHIALGLLGISSAVAQFSFPDDSGPSLPPLRPLIAVAYFPPNAPIYGTPIAANVYRSTFRPAPDGLAVFANEYFYPALGTRLLNEKLNAKMQARLVQFTRTRQELVNEIIDAVNSLEFADDASRQTELARLAARQSPRILGLEAEAEQLRDDMVTGGIFGVSVDWSARREWKLDPARTSPTPWDKQSEFQVVRAYAYYQRGLSVEQRGLLRELAMELEQQQRIFRQRNARQPANVPVPQPEDPAAMFFSPETARFVLPKGLPPEVITKIGTFNHDKSALKQELRAAVVEYDRSWSGRRTDAFSELADKQWPRLVALAELAEEIRRDLAAMPPPKPIRPPPIPRELMTRIQEFNREVEELAAELHAYVEQHGVPILSAPSSFTPDERRGWYQRLATAQVEARKKATEDFIQSRREQYDELARRRSSIRDGLEIVAKNQLDPKTGQPMSVEAMLRSFNAAMQAFAALGREEVIYRNYRIAMLYPGLSPEQRRLLFGATIVGLAQPLPGGEMMPTGRGGFMR